jgi:hypothetical protein
MIAAAQMSKTTSQTLLVNLNFVRRSPQAPKDARHSRQGLADEGRYPRDNTDGCIVVPGGSGDCSEISTAVRGSEPSNPERHFTLAP